MATDLLIAALAFIVTLLATEVLASIVLIAFPNGKYKLRFHSGNLNPFISNDKTLLVWVVQLIVTGLLSIPIGNYFEYFLKQNEFYYVPIFCLVGISCIVIGTKRLDIKMNRDLWWAIAIFSAIALLALYALTGGELSQLQRVQLVSG
jgi:hypothetical protein